MLIGTTEMSIFHRNSGYPFFAMGQCLVVQSAGKVSMCTLLYRYVLEL